MVKKQQVHKRIVLNFMKDVFDGYEERQISLDEGIAMLKMSRSNFFRYLNQYRKDKNKFGIEHVRDVGKNRCGAEEDEKIAELLRPDGINAEVEIIYQSIEGLHNACPNNKGDWYFTGNYPTPGGNKVVNKSFINYMEGKNVRAY